MDVGRGAGRGLFLLLRGTSFFIDGQFFLGKELFRHIGVALQRRIGVVRPVPLQVRYSLWCFARPWCCRRCRGGSGLSTLGLTSHRLRRHQSGRDTNSKSHCA
jgi:hypothetical protein